MWGPQLFTGGHFDAYILDYYDYQPGAVNDDVFSVPEMCPKKISPDVAVQKTHWLAQVRSILPNAHFGKSSLPIASLLVPRHPI